MEMKKRSRLIILIWLCLLAIPATAQLRVVEPNGQETYTAGQPITVKWTGIPESIPVVIEFSSDNGATWEVISKETTGNSFLWSSPQLSSTECLIHVKERSVRQAVPQLLYSLAHDSGAITSVTFSPDGYLLATTGWDRTIRIWDVATGKNLRTFRNYRRSTLQTVFSPDGSKLASTSLDSMVCVLDLLTGVTTQKIPQDGIIWAVDFTPNGETLAVSNDDGSITLWEVKTGQRLYSFQPHNESVRSLYYSADGKFMIASSTDRSASIIETTTYSPVQYFDHHTTIETQTMSDELWMEESRKKVVNGIQLTKDQATAITCGFNGLIKYWDTKSGELLDERSYHSGAYVSRIVLSPDNRWLLSTGYDSTAQIIYMESHESVCKLVQPKGQVVSAAFSPDGYLFALAHWYNTITVWSLGPYEEDFSDATWFLARKESSTSR